MPRLLTGGYIVLVLYAASAAVGAASRAGMLIPVALPLAAALILAVRWLKPPAELAAWAVFTSLLLGGTYLSTGSPLETGALVIYFGLTALGLFRSPYFLTLAWLIHPLWDFLPRDLPAQLVDLPMACLLYDIPIGLYLLWGARQRRWLPFQLPLRRTAAAGQTRSR